MSIVNRQIHHARRSEPTTLVSRVDKMSALRCGGRKPELLHHPNCTSGSRFRTHVSRTLPPSTFVVAWQTWALYLHARTPSSTGFWSQNRSLRWVHTSSHRVEVICTTESTSAVARSCITRDSGTACTEVPWKKFLSLVSLAAAPRRSDPSGRGVSIVER